MHKHLRFPFVILCVCTSVLLFGCAAANKAADHINQATGSKDKTGSRDSTPKVLVPDASGSNTFGNDAVTIDASNTGEGYIMVRYNGSNQKVKLQFATPDGITYSYFLKSGSFETFPITGGTGSYHIDVLENVSGDMYAVAYAQDFDVSTVDEFKPYLYPNQYSWFTADSKAVAEGVLLAKSADTDLDVVSSIYDYVINNITYDEAKAASITTDYLPVVDETMNTQKGICFDYAALMTCMLRSQGIPTKLEVGYSGQAYHSWISTYIKDVGWVDNIIEFDGTNWSLMDPTLAANNDGDSVKEYVGDGSNYTVKFSY